MHWSKCRRHWSSIMPSTIESVVAKYLRSGNPAQRTHEEFFNYGVDTGTVWKTEPFHEPILWRHVRTIPYSMEEERGQTIASGHFAASRESNSKPVLRAVMSKSGYSRISARHAQRITTNMSRSHLSRSLAIPWQESPIVTTPIARRWRSRPS